MATSVPSLSLIQALFPVERSFVRQVSLVAVGIGFITFFSQFQLSLISIPITLQSLAILLIAFIYGLRLASITILGYLLLGSMGLAVFSASRSGWAMLTGATGGYLLGFALAVVVVGLLVQRNWDKGFSSSVFALLIANVFIYLPGLLWLRRFMVDWPSTLEAGLLPFISGDLIKILLIASLLPASWKLLARTRRSKPF